MTKDKHIQEFLNGDEKESAGIGGFTLIHIGDNGKATVAEKATPGQVHELLAHFFGE